MDICTDPGTLDLPDLLEAGYVSSAPQCSLDSPRCSGSIKRKLSRSLMLRDHRIYTWPTRMPENSKISTRLFLYLAWTATSAGPFG